VRGALVLAAGMACAWLAAPATATVYKWSDAHGLIHYTDLPPPPDGKLISIDSTYDRAKAQSARPEPARPRAPPRVRTPSATEQAQLKQTVASDVANAQAGDCKQAQDRYQNYVRSRHLYKEGPNKERIYLTDAELETERVNAKREVDEACASAASR